MYKKRKTKRRLTQKDRIGLLLASIGVCVLALYVSTAIGNNAATLELNEESRALLNKEAKKNSLEIAVATQMQNIQSNRFEELALLEIDDIAYVQVGGSGIAMR